MKILKQVVLILPLIGGLLLIASSFLTWAYGVDSKQPYSAWSELIRFANDPLHWLWFISTGILGLLIVLLSIFSIFHLLVRDYLSRKIWPLTLGLAAISFVLNFFWVALTPTAPSPPSYNELAGLSAGAFAAVLGPLIAIPGLLLGNFIRE